jgi:DNA-binding CsgD family transcriptional regulator
MMHAPPTTDGRGLVGQAERTVGRERLLQRVERELIAARSVSLRGGPGVGKSRVLDELRRRHLGPVHAVAAGPSDALTAIADHVATPPGGDQAVLVLVDDAELLPRLDVARLHAWQERPWCRIATAVAADGADASPAGTWWQGDRWRCLNVAPLSRTATGELLVQLLGGPAEPRLVHELWRLSGGNPVAIGELLIDARATGAVAPGADSWRLVAPLSYRRLTSLLGGRLEGLSEVARHDLQVLALASPLPIRAASSLVHPQGVKELEARGLVRFRSGVGGRSLAIVDAVHGEVVRADLQGQQRARLLGEVAAVFDRLELSDRRRLDLARWRLELGGWSSQRLHETAVLARVRGEVVLAHDLASAAVALGAGAATSRLASLAAIERCAGAPVDPQSGHPTTGPCDGMVAGGVTEPSPRTARRPRPGPTEVGPVDADALLAGAHARAIGGGRWAEASADLLAGAPRVATDRHDEVVAYAALLSALGGDIGTAQRTLSSLGDHAPTTPLDGTAVAAPGPVLAAVAGAVVAAARGEHGRVQDAVDRTRAVWSQGGPVLLPIAEHLLAGLELLSDVERPLADRILEADDEVDRSLRRFGAETAWWYAVDGWLRWWSGDLAGARHRLVAGVLACRTADPLRLRARLVADLAVLAALTGSAVEAEWRLGQVGADRHEHQVVGERCRLAELLVGVVRHGVADLGPGLLALARSAAAAGRSMDVVRLLHHLARLEGPAVAAATAATIVSEQAGAHPLGVAVARHLTAWAEADATQLDAVARSFAVEGQRLLGAEAAAQAGRCGAGERSDALAGALVAGCSEATTPAVIGVEPVVLSPRRRDAAVLAMTGVDGRTVAARLGVSVRTVENHLARVYRAVGVAGRQELAALFDPDVAPFAVIDGGGG